MPEPRQLTAETLGLEILDALEYELGKIPLWADQTQMIRQASVTRLRTVTEKLVRSSLMCLVGETFPALPATLSGTSFGDGIKATLKLAKDDPHRHALSDAVGKAVVIVITDPTTYLQRMDRVQQDPQRELFGVIPEADGEIRASMTTSAQPDAQAECVCGDYWADHVDLSTWKAGDPTDCGNKECTCKAFTPVAVPDAPPADEWIPPPEKPAAEAAARGQIADIRMVLVGQLEQVGIVVATNYVEGLTDAQCRAAYEYAVRKQAYPPTALPKPFFVPDPTPIVGE